MTRIQGESGGPEAPGEVPEPVWLAEIHVMFKASVNDPQGLSIRNALRSLGFDGVQDVRAGKLIQVRLDAVTRTSAEAAVERMCSQLLANPVIETFAFSLQPISPQADELPLSSEAADAPARVP